MYIISNRDYSNLDDTNIIVKEDKRNKTTPRTKTFSGVAGSIEQSKIDSQFGQSVGVDKNMGKNPSIYATNAEYSEMQRQQTTAEKIATQGGVNAAVATDVAESAMKAAAQQGATKGQVEEMAKSAGMDSAEAKKFAEAITSGAQSAKDLIASGITGAAASLAGALSGGKTASDLAKVGEYKSTDDFVAAQQRDAVNQTTGSRIMSDFAQDATKKANMINEEKAQMLASGGKERLQQYMEEGQKMGFLDENGNAVDDAMSWVRGRATFDASGMNKNEQGVIAGARVSTAYNAVTGKALTNVDGSHKIEEGRTTNAHIADPNDINEAYAQEGIGISMSPTKIGQVVGGKTFGAVMSVSEGLGVPKENAEEIADTLSYGATGLAVATAGAATLATAGTAVEAVQRAGNWVLEKRETVKDANGNAVPDTSKPIKNSSGDLEFSDANGKKVFQDAETGEFYTQAKDGGIEPHSGEKLTQNFEPKTRVQRGTPSKVWDASWRGVKKMSKKSSDSALESMGAERFNDTGDSPTDSTEQGGTDDTPKEQHDQSAHKTPPNSNSEPSVTQNSKQGKSYKDVLNDFEEMKNTPPEEFAK